MRQSLTFEQSYGNFLAILSVVARHDPVIAERIQYGPANAKYTHHTIQNALLDIMKDIIKIIDNNTDADGVVDANGFKLQMDRRFAWYLFVTRHILKKAKFATDMLQKSTNDLSNAIDLIATFKEELDVCRSREKCQQFWDEA